ncbi:MAG TPA: response regulator [Anaerolineaceae bacterium]|nr:response regulator [Anaerolineaceae bacterium]
MPAGEKVRVLIVDDITETRESIKRMLLFDANIEVVSEAKNGREAIEYAQQTKPDVVLMDINMPDMDGITATESIRKKVPFTQIIILSVQSDSNYMRRAMLAGARDFLSKPPMIDELVAAIRRAGKMAADERSKAQAMFPVSQPGSGPLGPIMPVQQGKIIVVYSPKGGTGCTTIATNLALLLQKSESRTCLVDGSLQYGDVAIFLNVLGKNTVLDLAPRVDELDPEFVQEVMVQHSATGLHMLACPSRPEFADQVTGEQFSKLIEYLRNIYAYIVIDSASYLSETVQTALDCADFIVLITTQEIAAIKNCNLFLNLADASGIPRNRIIFVMNKHDRRIGISPEKVGESLRHPMSAVVPLDERVVIPSINRGVPFVLESKPTSVSRAVVSLAELLQKKIEAMDTPEAEGVSRK